MYGMVNQAVKDLVMDKFGESKWNEICAEVQISANDFIIMDYYPDKLTYDLVAAVSKKTSLPGEVVLSEFGKYWVLFTAREGYGPLMDMFGKDFIDCLKNLNNLHSRMGMSMPNITPPSFEFTEVGKNHYYLNYLSKRAGLSPMVEGLLRGLAEKYKIKVEIKLVEGVESSVVKRFEIKILE